MTTKRVNQTLIVFWLAMLTAYLVYRLLFTLTTHDLWFVILFYLAELHGAFAFFLFCFETWDPRHFPPKPAPKGMSVDIYICTYNEDPELLRKTILGAESIVYPHNTYVLDDGRRETVKTLAEQLGVRYITRPDNAYAKAGNINHALQHTSGDFIAILDADHVPLSDFLDRMLGYFDDPRVAFVQSPQTFYNLEAFEEDVDYETCSLREEAELFFHLLLPGKNRWNAAYFCGTGGVLRRTALEDVGGFATETITEDIHTSLRMHARGWRSVYIADHLASGQAAHDLPSYHTQRTRWALGNLRVMLTSNPLTLPGLTVAQRLCYLSSMMHWTNGLRKTVLYATPLLALLFGTYPVAHVTGTLVVLYVAQLVGTILLYKFLTRGRGGIMTEEVFSMLNFWVFTSAFIRACFKLGVKKFNVTDKAGDVRFSLTSIKPHLAFLALTTIGLTWGTLHLYYDLDHHELGMSVALFWALWNAAVAFMVIQMATAVPRASNDIRFFDHIPVLYRLKETSDNPERLAVTLEYGEDTMSIVTYEPLEVGETFDATLILRFFRLSIRMEVVHALSLPRPNGCLTFRYEVKLEIVDEAARDMLNMHTMLYTTPRLLDALGEHGRSMMHRQDFDWLLHPRSGGRRIDFPITLDPAHNTWAHSRVERLAEDRIGLLVETPVSPGVTYPALIGTPLGVIRGELEVTSSELRPFHGSPMYTCDAKVAWSNDQAKRLVEELTRA